MRSGISIPLELLKDPMTPCKPEENFNQTSEASLTYQHLNFRIASRNDANTAETGTYSKHDQSSTN
jgi:hypothetical protein